MDRHKSIQFGIKDRQCAKVLYTCAVSTEEIYEENTYLETPEGDVLLDDKEVLMERYGVVRKIAGEEIED